MRPSKNLVIQVENVIILFFLLNSTSLASPPWPGRHLQGGEKSIRQAFSCSRSPSQKVTLLYRYLYKYLYREDLAENMLRALITDEKLKGLVLPEQMGRGRDLSDRPQKT